VNEREKKKAKRLETFIAWIADFKALSQENGIALSFIDSAAEILNDVYWILVDNYVRPLVTDERNQENHDQFIGRFKIISATELAIVHVQPILDSDERVERKLNASFAYWVGLNILKTFNPDVNEKTFGFVDNYKENIEGIDPSEIQTIQEDHVTWLELLDPQVSTPIISNAQTWRLLNLALLAIEKKLDYNAET
jgi:hypothetical protein